jgi:FkbM family methyltransferase
MIVKVGPVAVDLIDKGDGIVTHIREGRGFEARTLEIWARLCGEANGRTVVDVGCYTGLFAISAALLGCKVAAFEPMTANHARIVENAENNNVRHKITLLRVALADRIGVDRINYNPNVRDRLTSGASLVNRRLTGRIDVAVGTLDSYNLGDVAAIKIDVERGEPEVLAGARQTLARCRPALLVEVLDAPRRAAVRAALPDYEVAEEIDDRNWLMLPT